MAGGLLATRLAAEAQPTVRIPRVGVLSPAPAAAVGRAPYHAFREALSELGYVEDRNIVLEFRFADGKYQRLPQLAAELARLEVDVIVTDGGDTVARAAMNATRTIPIVMGTSRDPIGAGLVASLARPGGNVTGFIFRAVELAGKLLQILKEMVPAVTRVAVLWDPETGAPQFRVAETAARSLGVKLMSLPVRGTLDLDAAFETARRQRAGALLQLSSRMMSDNREAIAERALKHRLPGMGEIGFAEAGGLASYGPRAADNFRRAAVYVDKILKGARPGDLPVEQPTKFALIINLKTAKALGLTIPPTLLARADEVIHQ
jgi:putative ABC transport system substrate-binding protein